jgi:hypothetical protein
MQAHVCGGGTAAHAPVPQSIGGAASSKVPAVPAEDAGGGAGSTCNPADYPAQWAVFKDLDVDSSGLLDEDEIWEWVAEKDEGVANELMSSLDTNGDGAIDFNEFLEVWRLLYGAGAGTKKSSAAAAPGVHQVAIEPLDLSDATQRNRPEPEVSDDDILELCGFDLSLVEFHKTLIATGRQESTLAAAATRVQACFRGHRWRSSSALQALRNQKVSGRRRRRPTAADPEYRRALAIGPSLLLEAAFKHIDTNHNGRLTRDELQAFNEQLASRWHKLDADQNGVISRDEWNVYFATMRTRAIAKVGATAGEQQYHRFIAVLVWQAMVDLSSIEACVRANVLRTPATPVSTSTRAFGACLR